MMIILMKKRDVAARSWQNLLVARPRRSVLRDTSHLALKNGKTAKKRNVLAQRGAKLL
jgi:hypothetical protein